MAVGSRCFFEIRSTGDALNGGGFVVGASGTDYSQQDSYQYAGSDLVCTNATSAAPVVTSASHTFVPADVGNLINIISGTSWLPTRYNIVSVSGGAATLSNACGSVASVSGGTYRVGGAFNMGTSADSGFFSCAANVGLNKYYIKSGNYSLSANLVVAQNAVGTTPNVVEGYAVTRGDLPTGSTRPLINTGTFLVGTGGNFTDWTNISFTGNGTIVFSAGLYAKILSCKFVNTSTTAARTALNISNACFLDGVECISYRGNACTSAANCQILYSYFHDSDIGYNCNSTSNACLLRGCIIESNVTAAVQRVTGATGTFAIDGCTLYGSENKTGTGILMNASECNTHVTNSIIYGFVTGASHATANQTSSFSDYNNFYNNTIDRTNFGAGAHDNNINPLFANVGQITGTTATTSGNVLTDSSANFSSVVDGRDFCYIKSGTGVTVGQYLITGHTTTTLTLDIAPGTNATANKVYQITTGRNFGVRASLEYSLPLQSTTINGAVGAAPRTRLITTGSSAIG